MTPHLEKPSGALGNLMLGTVGLLAHLSASRRLLPIRLSIIALACNCRRTGAIVLARMATLALLVVISKRVVHEAGRGMVAGMRPLRPACGRSWL